MRLIPEKDAESLRQFLAARLVGPVTIDYYTTPAAQRVTGRAPFACPTCQEGRDLLEDVAALSDRITLRVHEGGTGMEPPDERVPALVLSGAAKGRVRFFGVPTGLEFAALLEGLTTVARGTSQLTTATKEALETLVRDVHIQVFVTPTCPFCPRAAATALQMAVESAHVTADVVDAAEFPDLVERYGVQGVPKIVVNETTTFVGAEPEARFLAHVLRAAA
jgi:glutaredoxin-like protein